MEATKKEKKKKQKENRKKSQSVRPTETYAREEEDSRVIAQDVEWFISFWNRTMEENHAKIPHIDYLKKTQVTKLKCRQYHFGKERLRTIIIKASKSDYLNCRTGKRANMQIDWYLDHDHLENVYQGKYDNYEVDERAMTEEERRQLDMERYRQQQEARRAENRAIEEQIREEEHQRRERQQKEWERNKPSQADLKRILGDNWLLD